jgi:hypothetical protein
MTNGLLLSYTEPNGTPHPTSYWEFDNFSVQNFHDGADATTENTSTVFALKGWHDKATHDAQLPALAQTFSLTLPPGPIVATATVGDSLTALYAAVIATLPTFATATTV